jgi:hypothetical protein
VWIRPKTRLVVVVSKVASRKVSNRVEDSLGSDRDLWKWCYSWLRDWSHVVVVMPRDMMVMQGWDRLGIRRRGIGATSDGLKRYRGWM